MALPNEPQVSLDSTGLNKLQGLLPRSLQLLILAALTSCTQPSGMQGWQYGKITQAQYDASLVQSPIGRKVVQPGNPVSYAQVPYTTIAQPKPQPYPGNNTVQQSNRSGIYTHPSQRVISKKELVYLYGGLYDNPQKAASELPLYAFSHPRAFQQYIVQPGDTFSEICKKFGFDRRVVWYYNWKYIKNAHILIPGQTIQLPVF